LDAHITNDAYPRATQVIERDGRVTAYFAPQFLQGWARDHVGSGAGFMTRPGMVWTMRALTGFSARQGLYLQLGNARVLRIDDGDPGLRPVVSPSGCRLFVSRIAGDANRLKTAAEQRRAVEHV
jgi:hypothetical protein